jgi:hypothetical protein
MLANKERQHPHPQPHPRRTRRSPSPRPHRLALLLDPVCLALRTHRQAQTLRPAHRYSTKRRKQVEHRNPAPACLEPRSLRPAERTSPACLAPRSQPRLPPRLRLVSSALQREVSLWGALLQLQGCLDRTKTLRLVQTTKPRLLRLRPPPISLEELNLERKDKQPRNRVSLELKPPPRHLQHPPASPHPSALEEQHPQPRHLHNLRPAWHLSAWVEPRRRRHLRLLPLACSQVQVPTLEDPRAPALCSASLPLQHLPVHQQRLGQQPQLQDQELPQRPHLPHLCSPRSVVEARPQQLLVLAQLQAAHQVFLVRQAQLLSQHRLPQANQRRHSEVKPTMQQRQVGSEPRLSDRHHLHSHV